MQHKTDKEVLDGLIPDSQIEKTAVIRKEKGKWCVRSPDNPDWNGGCYNSEEKAKARLKEVEYFKHANMRPIGFIADPEKVMPLIEDFIVRFNTRESEDPAKMLEYFEVLANKYGLDSVDKGQARGELRQYDYVIPYAY